MNERPGCGAAERLAGAIALGEAGDAEREIYRSHLAGCPGCLNALGGERAIERVMTHVAYARDSERWEPDLRAALGRARKPRYGWGLASALAAAVVIAFAGMRMADRPQPLPPTPRSASVQEAHALAALNTETAPHREGRAESLSVGASAFSATVELNVNERGVPVRCTVARSSGNAVLDRSMCRTAMHSQYTLHAPK
ncbi:MAG TPA: hypothetical protein VFE16_05700 [Candidatus Cybelea sp.]|jgi:hypothetical protein|nr:hypothetical protein [Candidatus Cybelea sp.]